MNKTPLNEENKELEAVTNEAEKTANEVTEETKKDLCVDFGLQELMLLQELTV